MQVVEYEMPWETVTLCPVGDIQHGSITGDLDRYASHVAWTLNQPNPWYLGLGDYIDLASPSNRARFAAANLYDVVPTQLDLVSDRLVTDVVKASRGTERRWLGALEGHHYWTHMDGTTSDMEFCRRLVAPFLGSSTLVRLKFLRQDGRNSLTCTIFASHGSGGGQKASAPLNRLENLVAYIDADIYVVGHMSKKAAAPIDQLFVDRAGNLKHRTKLIVGAGGFSQGYKQGSSLGGRAQGSYVEKALMAPVALGAPVVTITPEHTRKEDKLDIHVSL